MPASPPDWMTSLLRDPEADPAVAFRLLASPEVEQFVRRVNDRYLHWDKVRYQELPKDVTPALAWAAVELSRRPQQQKLPLRFEGKGTLTYWLTPQHQEWVSIIDQQAGGTLGGRHGQSIPDDNEQYLFNSLMEEAIASSQLEGACTTREVGKELLRTGRQPHDKAEQMILNNYRGILEIRELKNEKLTPALLLHLHEVLTKDTLDLSDGAGRFRRPNEKIHIVDVTTGESIHTPPPAEEIDERIRELCDFANTRSVPFVHPVVKAMALHFAIGFIHPFVDGNGRSARALFYWYMLRSGYWLFEYLPISRIIIDGPIKYARAYLYTETDRGDLAYFNHYHLYVVIRAINDLHKYLAEQQKLLVEAERLLENYPQLNHRQRAVIGSALRRSTDHCTIQEHEGKYRVTYNTARADLLSLEELGLLTKSKRPGGGKGWVFRPAADLMKRLRRSVSRPSKIQGEKKENMGGAQETPKSAAREPSQRTLFDLPPDP